MADRTSFDTIYSYLTEDIRAALRRADSKVFDNATEIRLYNGRGIAVISIDSVRFLASDGTMLTAYSDRCMQVTAQHLRNILTRLSRFSVYSHEKELSEGCFVLENGVRAGVSGTFAASGNGILKDISSVNFRIAREVIGCADEFFSKTFGRSILICGKVNSGKTTMLRDICRSYGNIMKCALIDERNEIAALRDGRPQNDIGALTDVITGRPRHEGIISAVRTLSPDVVLCDEIADSKDASAVRECVGCGVRIIATVHAGSLSELYSRRAAQELLSLNAFEKAVFISHGQLVDIRSLNNGDKMAWSVAHNVMRRALGDKQSFGI